MARIPYLVLNEVAMAVSIYPASASSDIPNEISLVYGYDQTTDYRLDEDHPYRVEEEVGGTISL